MAHTTEAAFTPIERYIARIEFLRAFEREAPDWLEALLAVPLKLLRLFIQRSRPRITGERGVGPSWTDLANAYRDDPHFSALDLSIRVWLEESNTKSDWMHEQVFASLQLWLGSPTLRGRALYPQPGIAMPAATEVPTPTVELEAWVPYPLAGTASESVEAYKARMHAALEEEMDQHIAAVQAYVEEHSLTLTRRPHLRRHASWFVRYQVNGERVPDIAASAEVTPKSVHNAINMMAELTGIPRAEKRPGRPQKKL